MTANGQIFDFLCEKFPPFLACDFDNVGFLIGDKSAKTKGVLICLDCDKSAIDMAKHIGANLIISHHPVIFEGLKTVTEESVAYTLIKNGISVISMHTNLDMATGGVNDCLCKALGIKEVENFEASDGFILRKGKVSATAKTLAASIKKALNFGVRYVGMGKIENVLVCSGSGGDYLDDAISGGFDALITADCKHHQFIKAANCGIALFDCGHYASENVVIEPLTKLLCENFAGIKFTAFDDGKIKSL